MLEARGTKDEFQGWMELEYVVMICFFLHLEIVAYFTC